jgi:uncharacterized protein
VTAHPSSNPRSPYAVRKVRPVVRSFRAAFEANALAWVRAGGHAIVWASAKKAWLVVPKPAANNPEDYGKWAAYDLGRRKLLVASKGPFAGFGVVSLKGDDLPIVETWGIRDATHTTPTRAMSLDCVACGACCKNNNVVLDAADMKRLRSGAPKTFVDRVKRKDGRLVLTLLADGRCAALTKKGMCGVYDYRPEACREFPAGTECCLFAREEGLGIVDGARKGPALFGLSEFAEAR